jgi:hypothetical protein
VKRVLPGETIPADADEVVLAPGVHHGSLEIERSLVLRGEPGAILDGGARGWTVLIQADEATVRIEGLTLRNGHAEVGANLYVNGWSEVELVDCRFEDGRALGAGGAGAWIAAGQVRFRDCSFSGNLARWGSDLVATGAAEVSAERTRFAGDVAAREGAQLTLSHCRVEGRLDLRGTTTRAPEVSLLSTEVAVLVNDPELPATLGIQA